MDSDISYSDADMGSDDFDERDDYSVHSDQSDYSYSGDEAGNGDQQSENGSDNEAGQGEANNEENGEAGDDVVYRNSGWADAMAKLLRANKPKNKKSIILAKAKKDADIVKSLAERGEKPTFEIEGEIPEVKPDVPSKEKPKETREERLLRRQKRKEWDLIGRVKPDITSDREKERFLAKLATKGVVQLFNAVKVQQKTIETKFKEAGHLERKREKVLSSIDKSAFLNLLKGNANVKSEPRAEVKSEPVEKPTWSVLREDFLPEARMRDWNKQSSESEDST